MRRGTDIPNINDNIWMEYQFLVFRPTSFNNQISFNFFIGSISSEAEASSRNKHFTIGGQDCQLCQAFPEREDQRQGNDLLSQISCPRQWKICFLYVKKLRATASRKKLHMTQQNLYCKENNRIDSYDLWSFKKIITSRFVSLII